MKRCLGCMRELTGDLGAAPVCPDCGYVQNAEPKEAYHLRPGTVLQDRYLVGRVLGYGGFGVTYVGWDEKLSRKVAIKEYLPSSFATRLPGQTRVTAYAGEATEQFNAGLGRFIEEARNLAQFNGIPGIVDIYDTFAQNGTAYIVMQFLKGRDVKTVLAASGPMPYEKALPIILSLCDTLAQVHQKGVIHRDIAPDNIFLTDEGEVKLLDFGASRYATSVNSKSLSVILKSGYAPEEQYRSRGNQGSWSDVYALAATFYKMLTGKTPPDSMERAVRDELQEPSRLGADLPKGAENAILNAMNVRQADRTQTVQAFKESLGADTVKRVKGKAEKDDTGRTPPGWKGFFLVALLVVLAVGGWLIWRGSLPGGLLSDTFGSAVPEGSVNAPGLINLSTDAGKEQARKAGLDFLIVGTEYDEKIEKGRILFQDPRAGQVVRQGEQIGVTISGGAREEAIPVLPETTAAPEPTATPAPTRAVPATEPPQGVTAAPTERPTEAPTAAPPPTEAPRPQVPDLTYRSVAQALALFEETEGLESFGGIRYEYHDDIAEGLVIRQERTDADQVLLYVSAGRDEGGEGNYARYGRLRTPILVPSADGVTLEMVIAGNTVDDGSQIITDFLASRDQGATWEPINPKYQATSMYGSEGQRTAYDFGGNGGQPMLIPYDLSTQLAKEYPELQDQELRLKVRRRVAPANFYEIDQFDPLNPAYILEEIELPQTFRFTYAGGITLGGEDPATWPESGGPETTFLKIEGDGENIRVQIDERPADSGYSRSGPWISVTGRTAFGLTAVAAGPVQVDGEGGITVSLTPAARASFTGDGASAPPARLPDLTGAQVDEAMVRLFGALGYDMAEKTAPYAFSFLPVLSADVPKGRVVDYVLCPEAGQMPGALKVRLYISVGSDSAAPALLSFGTQTGYDEYADNWFGVYNGGTRTTLRTETEVSLDGGATWTPFPDGAVTYTFSDGNPAFAAAQIDGYRGLVSGDDVAWETRAEAFQVRVRLYETEGTQVLDELVLESALAGDAALPF